MKRNALAARGESHLVFIGDYTENLLKALIVKPEIFWVDTTGDCSKALRLADKYAAHNIACFLRAVGYKRVRTVVCPGMCPRGTEHAEASYVMVGTNPVGAP